MLELKPINGASLKLILCLIFDRIVFYKVILVFNPFGVVLLKKIEMAWMHFWS